MNGGMPPGPPAGGFGAPPQGDGGSPFGPAAPGIKMPRPVGSPGDGPPVVWKWYVAYAVAMAVLYLLVAVGGGFVFAATTRGEDQIQGVIMGVIGLPLAILYGVAPFLRKTSSTYTFHLVLIGIGLTSACCIPACLPLLLYWLKPETKAFFGKY